MFWLGIACLLTAWAVLFLAYVTDVHMATHAPRWILFAVIGLGALLVASSRVPASWRASAAIALAAVVIAFSLVRHNDDGEADVAAWKVDAGHRIAETLSAVGNEIARLHRLSSAIGAVTSEFLTAGELRDPFPAFALLDSLAVDASRGGALPPGTEIGIQVFDANGESFAWAGWPQSLDDAGLGFVAHGKELLYSRKVSLYRILTHVIPVAGPDGVNSYTVVVDMPLEVKVFLAWLVVILWRRQRNSS